MKIIKLKSLNFDLPPFRKLGSITIPIAERITVLAGHNGIGKSTILGLVANGSGLRDATKQSYLNRAFDANLNEIVHLDFVKEYEAYKNSDAPLPAPSLLYEIDGIQLIKRCSITRRLERREVRVVVRNDPHKPMLSLDNSVQVGPDAKVPLPTLYLGMTRMLPIGESNPTWVKSASDDNLHPTDAEFIQKFIADVIAPGQQNNVSNKFTTQSIKGTKKTAKHPEYAYSTKCISLGQDSLSAIATAVASFQKLKREWTEYPGGLLVIDELDAGFHPHAQEKLVKALSNAARKLNLQILATTHSMCLIEAIHPDGHAVRPGGKHVDGVVYLTDTIKPRVASDYSLEAIRRDMSLTPPAVIPPHKAKTLKIYLEDPEAHFVLKCLLTAKLKRRVNKEAGVKLKPIPLSVGCENLKGFHKHDPYFLTVLIALDADTSIPKPSKNTQNVIKLPGALDSKGQGLSPERTLYTFIQALADVNVTYPTSMAALEAKTLSRNQLQEHLLDCANIVNRESAKKWMNAKLQQIKDWRLYELWLSEHPHQVKTFEDALVAAAIATAKRT